MLFLVSMGKTELSHDIFFEFSLRPFEVIEVFYCTIVSNAKGNIAKSNKSELWNPLSHRGLSSTTSKGLSEN